MNVERYIEVFGGGGWVLFHKEPSPFEVFNDFNADLVNLYRCIRDKPEKLVQRLEYTLNAREDFEHIRKLLKSKAELTDVQRAAGYYQLHPPSYLPPWTASAAAARGVGDLPGSSGGGGTASAGGHRQPGV